MATTSADTPQTAPVGYAYCSWHKGYARDACLVRQPPDQGSGPAPQGLFACPPCRETYKLPPLEDR